MLIQIVRWYENDPWNHGYVYTLSKFNGKFIWLRNRENMELTEIDRHELPSLKRIHVSNNSIKTVTINGVEYNTFPFKRKHLK